MMRDVVGTSFYKAPELLKGNYNKSADIWAVGIVAYVLLCGYPPFNGDTDPVVHYRILHGQLEFPNLAWSSKSAVTKNFIKCLLKRDPDLRYTAKEALLHPWLLNLGATDAFQQDEQLSMKANGSGNDVGQGIIIKDQQEQQQQYEAVLRQKTSKHQFIVMGALIATFILALYPQYLDAIAAPAVLVLSAAEGISCGYDNIITPWKVSCLMSILSLI